MATPSKSLIDRRPLALVLFERTWRWLVYGAMGIFLYESCGAPWAEGLTPEGQRALAIFVVCVVLWVFHLLPLMVTSILAMLMPPLLGVLPASQSFALFGNQVIFFLLGAFILAAALAKCGLAERITLAALRFSGASPRRLSLGIYLTGALLSMVMSEHAVAALLFPIVLEICRVLELDPRRSNLGRLFFLSMAWGCITGGVWTLLGGARAPLAIGILSETTGEHIGFFEWTRAVWPAAAVLTVAGYVLLSLFFPIGAEEAKTAEEFLIARRRKLGRVSMRERLVGLVVLATIVSWVAFEKRYGLAEISLLAVVALFALRLITWREVEDAVNWGVLLMYGGAIALGLTFSKAGAAHWLASQVLAGTELTPFALVAVLAVLTLVLTEAVSNSAVVSVLLPLGLALAEPLAASPKTVTYAVAFISGLPCLLPMGTPALALAYSSRYVRVRHTLAAGAVFFILAITVFLAMVKWYWPLIGLMEGGAPR